MGTVVSKIIKANLVVFVMWLFLNTQMMMDHFLVSSLALQEGRLWTLLTSVFSHNMAFHLLLNMFVLYSFGQVMEAVLGKKRFILLYLAAGLGGSVSHCLTSSYLIHNAALPALGASGAVSGILVTFSFLFPKHLVFILGLIPLPAFLAMLLFVGSDLWGLISQTQGSGLPIGHGAHLGGAFVGAIYFYFFLKPRIRIRQH